MATTSFEAVREREKGLAGSWIVVGSLVGSLRSWKCSVQSHDADMSNAKISLTDTPKAYEEHTVFFAVGY
jgi:hypothetical protein